METEQATDGGWNDVLERLTARERASGARPAKQRGRGTPFEREVAVRLAAQGASPALVERVREALQGRATARPGGPTPAADRHVIDAAADAIGGLFAIASAPRLRGATRVLAFAGPTGGGKTTSLVKLATRMVRAERRVVLATLDTRRIGALEALRAHAALLAVPFFPLRSTSDLSDPKLVHAGVEALLVDTTGQAELDTRALERLRAALAPAGGALDAYLVLPATASRVALDEATRAFAPLAAAGTVLTKLDETRQPAPLLEHVLESRLPVAFLGDGPERTQLRRASGEHFADLLLRGRLA